MSPENVRIVTDSTARIPKEYIDKYNIGVAKLNIVVKERGSSLIKNTFKEEYDIDRPGFVKILEDRRLDVLTSAPTVGDFTEIFKEFKDRPTLFIHMAGKLSEGTPRAANSAKVSEGYDNVEIYDTENVCLIKRQVIDAAILADQGKSIKEISAGLDYSKKRSVLFVAIDQIYHLRKGGRASAIQSALLAVSGKKPILDVRNNKIELQGTEHGIGKSIELMEDLALSLKPTEICIFHGGDKAFEQIALNTVDEMRQKTDNKIRVTSDYAGPLLTVHTGSKVIAVGIFAENPIPEKVIYNAK
jgi:DegV family protein with EDD domain